jgi:hypothetical protein
VCCGHLSWFFESFPCFLGLWRTRRIWIPFGIQESHSLRFRTLDCVASLLMLRVHFSTLDKPDFHLFSFCSIGSLSHGFSRIECEAPSLKLYGQIRIPMACSFHNPTRDGTILIPRQACMSLVVAYSTFDGHSIDLTRSSGTDT